MIWNILITFWRLSSHIYLWEIRQYYQYKAIYLSILAKNNIKPSFSWHENYGGAPRKIADIDWIILLNMIKKKQTISPKLSTQTTFVSSSLENTGSKDNMSDYSENQDQDMILAVEPIQDLIDNEEK